MLRTHWNAHHTPARSAKFPNTVNSTFTLSALCTCRWRFIMFLNKCHFQTAPDDVCGTVACSIILTDCIVIVVVCRGGLSQIKPRYQKPGLSLYSSHTQKKWAYIKLLTFGNLWSHFLYIFLTFKEETAQEVAWNKQTTFRLERHHRCCHLSNLAEQAVFMFYQS